ncbi:MAG: hypothetical protein CVU57_24265 [Deltaproteobacteria bacterium HGW-Deltaproteobacteria-15]|nr:MAG: hypothetical protein CVU57_24265 [Deltaproteobacteria bacterium HGW-Deltaproteobacteria-15]
MASFLAQFTDRQIGEITTDEILSFQQGHRGQETANQACSVRSPLCLFQFHDRNNLDPEFRNHATPRR